MKEAQEKSVEDIRKRFGYRSIRAASLMGDLKMAQDGCETAMMPGAMYPQIPTSSGMLLLGFLPQTNAKEDFWS